MIVQMKYLIVACIFLAVGCNNTGPKKSTPDVKPLVEGNVKTIAVELSITGMTCTGCEQTIQSGISNVKGVKHVKANYKNGRAYVEFIPELADTIRMKEAISSSGYILTGIKPIPLDTLRSKL
jgi:copper chaperone CopZ